MPLHKALTIAGLDSGAGAGATADLKTFHSFGVYGMVALTSVTSQNTVEVRSISDVPPNVVEDEINVVAEDIGVDAAKTGMLSNSAIIATVSRTVRKWGFPLVVDPVMVAKSGARLLREDAVNSLRDLLLPIALVATPNIPEAEVLTGETIKDLGDMGRAARQISREFGTSIVIVKGGHLTGPESVDVIYDSRHESLHELHAPRINTPNTHGTGCSFSAAIAAGIAKGMDAMDAIRAAKEFITNAVLYSVGVGHGHGPVNSLVSLQLSAAKYDALTDSIKATNRLITAGLRSGVSISLLPLDYFRRGDEAIYVEFDEGMLSDPVFGLPNGFSPLTVEAMGKGLKGIVAIKGATAQASNNCRTMEVLGAKYWVAMGDNATDAADVMINCLSQRKY